MSSTESGNLFLCIGAEDAIGSPDAFGIETGSRSVLGPLSLC